MFTKMPAVERLAADPGRAMLLVMATMFLALAGLGLAGRGEPPAGPSTRVSAGPSLEVAEAPAVTRPAVTRATSTGQTGVTSTGATSEIGGAGAQAEEATAERSGDPDRGEADPVEASPPVASRAEEEVAAGVPPLAANNVAESTPAPTPSSPAAPVPVRASPSVTEPAPSQPAITRPATTRPTTAPSTTTVPPTTPSTGAPSTEPTTGQPAVAWEETFDRLDRSRWSLEHSTYGDGNDELQCYRPENVSVVNGRLVLRAVAETYTCPNGSTRTVTSGMVRSRGLTLSPGQTLEFRVKLTPADPANQGGLWPAVWSSGWAPGGWPRGGELDFLEVMTAVNPNRSIFSAHYLEPDGTHGVTNKPVVGSEPFSARWHVVAFSYGHNGRLTWTLDGRTVQTITSLDTIDGHPAPFDRPITEIKINLALGGRPGPLDPAALGATFEVDYIRAYNN